MSIFRKTTRALFNSDIAPPYSRLLNPKTLTSPLPNFSFRYMASGPAPPGIGPTLARVMSDPTLHKQADTEAKVAIEKAIAEEKLQMYFARGNGRIVHKGPLSAMPAEFQNRVPKEHTALWHVSNEDDMLLGVYVYVHAEAAENNMYLLRMKQLMEDEIKEAEVGGRLRDRKVFGIAQMGMSISFFQHGSGGGI